MGDNGIIKLIDQLETVALPEHEGKLAEAFEKLYYTGRPSPVGMTGREYRFLSFRYIASEQGWMAEYAKVSPVGRPDPSEAYQEYERSKKQSGRFSPSASHDAVIGLQNQGRAARLGEVLERLRRRPEVPSEDGYVLRVIYRSCRGS